MTEKSPPSNTELWLALKAGNTNALGQIYARHAGLVYGVALKVLTNPQEAEDLTQDIFIKLVKTSAYDPSRGSLRTFLAILTRSRAIDRLRSRKVAQHSQERLQADYAANQPDSPNHTIEQNEVSEEIKAALTQLSASQQQILKLTFYEGLTQASIAEKLNIPLGTVKSTARRGLLKLQKLLQSNLD